MQRLHSDDNAMAMLCRRPLEVAAHILWKFWRDECPQRAASLAYTTLLSLVPSLAVAFAMLKGFGGLESIQARVEDLVYTHLVTTSSLQVADYIQKFTEKVDAGTIGAVGFLALIITAVSLLNTVAGAFNRVWGVEDRRSLKDRFLTFFALIILGPLLFGASISITGTILHSQVWTRLSIPRLGPALSLLVPLLLTWGGFLLLYVVIPSAPLRLRPALLASLTVATTWEFVKIGFEWYVANVAGYGKVYASLSVIPVFLLWLYVGWVIALLGFEVAYFLQHPEACRGPVSWRAPSATVSAREAIRTFVAVAEAFVKGGKPVTAVQVAQQVPLRDDVASAGLAELERQGFVARVASPPDAYLPCRAPSSVKVADLWQDFGGGMAPSDGDMLDRLLAEAARSTARTLGHTTVQDLLDAGAASAAGEAARPSRDKLTELA